MEWLLCPWILPMQLLIYLQGFLAAAVAAAAYVYLVVVYLVGFSFPVLSYVKKKVSYLM